MTAVIELGSPIEVAGEKIEKISLREPTLADIRQLGHPYSLVTSSRGSKVMVEPDIVCNYITKLGAIPPSTVNKMKISDYQKCEAEIMNFFGS